MTDDYNDDGDTVECPNCGAWVYQELTRCPECGWNLYPPGESDEPGDGLITSRGVTYTYSFLIGWLAAGAVVFLVYWGISQVFVDNQLTWIGRLILTIGSLLGALVGGYIGAATAKRSPRFVGFVISIFTILSVLLFETRWSDVNLSNLLRPFPLLEAALIILAGVTGGMLFEWLESRAELEGHSLPAEDSLYKELLVRVRYDWDVADRLIEFERKKYPTATRVELIQRALDSIERSNQ
jgi:hypothetical protein